MSPLFLKIKQLMDFGHLRLNIFVPAKSLLLSELINNQQIFDVFGVDIFGKRSESLKLVD